MTIWTMIAAAAMLVWAISLALAMGPIWARAAQPRPERRREASVSARRPSKPAALTRVSEHSWVA